MIGWAIETLVATSLLMLTVLMLRGPVRRGFGPGLAYALWALPALRMLLPPLPADWRQSTAAPIARASETFTVLVIEPLGIDSAAPASHALSPLLVMGLLWGVGAALFLVWHAWNHARFCRRMLSGAARETIVAPPRVTMIETSAAAGPLAFGIWRRYVAFPRDFLDRYDAEERDLALAHELGHHARGDLIANWAALVMLALHWFNPIAWRAFRAFRADQEMANDARVLAGRDPAFRHAYGRAIVKSAHGGAISAACHLHTINELKRRLKMLSITRKSRTQIVMGVASVGLLTLTGLGVTASGTQAAETIRTSVGKTIGMDLSAIPSVSPVAAVAPRAAISTVVPVAAVAPVAVVAGQDSSEPLPPPPLETDFAAPPAPPAPPAVDGVAPVPPVPPVPQVAGTRSVQRVRVVRDGKVLRDDIMADMPDVSSRNCGDDKRNEMVVNERAGRKQRIIICTDRIAKAAEAGAAAAARSGEIERNAYRSALAGLRTARENMARDRSIAAEAREEALAAMDQSIDELQDDMAHAGDD